jgi:hypothetical protein
VKELKSSSDTVVLAAQGTPEGHWRFVNQSGEMFTVGTPDEMKRVVTVLYPEAKAGARLTFYMTEDTVLGQGVRFRALRLDADWHVVVGDRSYRLLPSRGEPRYVRIRDNVVVDVRGNPLLKEALERLDNPLAKAGVRLIVLEPDGPKTLSPVPQDTGKSAPVERIDPVCLAAVFAGLSGRTLVVCARGEGDLIYARPSIGPERSLPVGSLIAAAEGANVALVVLQFASTHQRPADDTAPCLEGGRPAPELTLGDILDAAADQSRHAPVAVALAGDLKVLDATMVGDPVAGTLPAIRLGDAQRRLGRSFFDHVPVQVPAIYMTLLILGWLGTPVARQFWGEPRTSAARAQQQGAGKARTLGLRLWSAGQAKEYPGRVGYWAARTVSLLVFALVFQPLTAVVTAPYNLVPQIWRAIMGPVHAWRRITRPGAGTKPAMPTG